ncbi:MAG: hypothetical protein NTU88_13700 [Armatimonadetes bacterium]|nr:hypothetical protein [Armatimonadota bacterium]
MPQLIRHGRTVGTFFDLLGTLENNMTDALAYTLSRSPVLLHRLVSDLGYNERFADEDVILSVQKRRPNEGITDIEIEIGTSFFAILEAKRGTALPKQSQLRRYAPVVNRHIAATRRLVAVTNATEAYAAAALKCISVPRVTLAHRSWRQLRALSMKARSSERHEAKRILDQFSAYLEVILGMETMYDNRVYVVALGAGNPSDGWSLSLIDIVVKRRRYFYPVGGRWPAPPNYLGFRYGGKLQRIHHVDGYEIFTNPHAVFPEAPNDSWCPHYCFRLGPPIIPDPDVPSGPRVQQNSRVWCMIDTLLTSRTISDALTETEKRKRRSGRAVRRRGPHIV